MLKSKSIPLVRGSLIASKKEHSADVWCGVGEKLKAAVAEKLRARNRTSDSMTSAAYNEKDARARQISIDRHRSPRRSSDSLRLRSRSPTAGSTDRARSDSVKSSSSYHEEGEVIDDETPRWSRHDIGRAGPSRYYRPRDYRYAEDELRYREDRHRGYVPSPYSRGSPFPPIPRQPHPSVPPPHASSLRYPSSSSRHIETDRYEPDRPSRPPSCWRRSRSPGLRFASRSRSRSRSVGRDSYGYYASDHAERPIRRDSDWSRVVCFKRKEKSLTITYVMLG